MIKLPLWVKWSRKIDLLKIIAGQSKPSTGTISAKDAIVAYLLSIYWPMTQRLWKRPQKPW
jgi:ABC-type polysaccharide/polyol phosphate transport system ATPase subunit